MITINKIAEDIAFAFGEQFNHTFRESIKNSIVDYRALFIRQDLERNPASYTDYFQSFVIKMLEVNALDYNISLNKLILISEYPVPRPLRLKGNGRTSFKFVGSKDRSIIFTYSNVEEFPYLCELPYQDSVIYWTWINNHLILLNTIKTKEVLIEDIVADPRDIKDCTKLVLPDDVEFPLPQDMIANIKKVVKTDFEPRMIKNGEEVNIQNNDRP